MTAPTLRLHRRVGRRLIPAGPFVTRGRHLARIISADAETDTVRLRHPGGMVGSLPAAELGLVWAPGR